MSIADQRAAAVAETIARIREIEGSQGVTRAALEQIKAELIALADRRELFPDEDFPPPPDGRGDILYCLNCDPDKRFALYLNRGSSQHDTPPHNHTTWAVVVGIEGEELNRFYERVDDGSVEGRGQVRQVDEFNVVPGTGVCMMPDDIHSIHMRGGETKKLFHMYGKALTELRERVKFNPDGTCEHFPPSPNIR